MHTRFIYSSSLPKKGCLLFNFPKRDLKKKTRKKKKHATKIPSSRGRFSVDSSCFFVSGPRVKTKRREKEKRENSKKDYCGKRKIKKKTRKSKKQEISKRLLFSFCSKGDKKQKQRQTTKSIINTE